MRSLAVHALDERVLLLGGVGPTLVHARCGLCQGVTKPLPPADGAHASNARSPSIGAHTGVLDSS